MLSKQLGPPLGGGVSVFPWSCALMRGEDLSAAPMGAADDGSELGKLVPIVREDWSAPQEADLIPHHRRQALRLAGSKR